MQTPPPKAPTTPTVRLCLGVTGHRAGHPSYSPNAVAIAATLDHVLDLIEAAIAETPPPFGTPFAPTRLHSLLADGADQLAAEKALARGWTLTAPLPFGQALNCAINALPTNAADARAVLAGGAAQDRATQARADAIRVLYPRAHMFELCDDDGPLTSAFLAMHDAPTDTGLSSAFNADCSVRVALAARLVIEHADLMIAVWDGAHTSFVGGTGHTIAAALSMGAPVLWIDPAAPDAWRILAAPEALACLREDTAPPVDREGQLKRIVAAALTPGQPTRNHAGHAPHAASQDMGVKALAPEHWRARSNPLWHAYRRIEALFSGAKTNPWRALRQTYETPDAIAAGSGAAVSAALASLPGADADFANRIKTGVLARFAWADGISAHLSDTYRSGMVINFALSALAVIGGVAYLPLVDTTWKWPFAGFELVLLIAILTITTLGQRLRWHGRWFETRRAAEYLRHAPILLAIGAARAPGRWPKGAETSWPEHYARHALREIGLPRAAATPAYLRTVLRDLIAPHVTAQRDYHHHKAKKLTAVHHNLDKLSERSFQIAVVSVGLYLLIAAAGALHVIEKDALKEVAKIFTFLGVALPTFGAGIAGIRYFGDFERFAAISEVTAGKLDAVADRIALLARAPDDALDYGPVAELAHAADDIVVSEIENWQAVFGGKHITVPV
jgi:hypothetical protein